MKEINITKNEENQRLDRFMGKLLKQAGKGFVLKSIRKKYIKVNGKKTSPSYRLEEGDVVSIYLAEATVDKFSVKDGEYLGENCEQDIINDNDILYEDKNLLAINKKPGTLTHGDQNGIVEIAKRYLVNRGDYDPKKEITFAPACCNRLDKNTSGIILIAKNNKTLMETNKKIADHKIKKIYLAFIDGCIKDAMDLKGYILKDNRVNKSQIFETFMEGSKYVETIVKPIKTGQDFTLAEIELITGRSHQIRAHLSYIKKPIVGDMKYGNRKTNDYFYKKYKIEGQMLHNSTVVIDDYFSSGKSLKMSAPIPDKYVKIINDSLGE
jgi:23S rRNA pseudouridine955/2504/2580 synthase